MSSSSELIPDIVVGVRHGSTGRAASSSSSEEELTRLAPMQHFFSVAQPTQVKDLSYTNKTLSRRDRLTSSKWLKTAGITTLFVVGVIGLGGGAVTLCVITGNIPSIFAFLQVLQGAGSLGTIGMFAVGGLSTTGGAAWILGLIITHYRKHYIPTMEAQQAKMVGGALKSEKDFFLYHDAKTGNLLKVGKTSEGEVYREPVIPQLNENEVAKMKQQLADAKGGEFVYQTLPGIDEFLSPDEIDDLEGSGTEDNGALEKLLEDAPVLTQQAARAKANAMRRPGSVIYRRFDDNLVYGVKKVGDELIEKPIGTGDVFLVRFNVDKDHAKGGELETLVVELFSPKEAKEEFDGLDDEGLDDIPLTLPGREERLFKGFYYINKEDGRLYSIVRTDEVKQTPEAAALELEEAAKEEETDALDHFISCLEGKTKDEVTELQERLLDEGGGRWEEFPTFKTHYLENHDRTADGMRSTRETLGGRESFRATLFHGKSETYDAFSALLYELLPKEGTVIDPYVEEGEFDHKRSKALSKMATTTPSTLFTPNTPPGIQASLDDVQKAMVKSFREEATMVDAVAVHTEIEETEKAIADEKSMAKRYLDDFNLKHNEYARKRLQDLQMIGMNPLPYFDQAADRYDRVFAKPGAKPDETLKVVNLAEAKAATEFIRQMYHQALEYIATHEGPLEILQRTDFKHLNLDTDGAKVLRNELIHEGLYPQYPINFGGQVAYLSCPFTDFNQNPSPIYVVAYVEVESGKFIPRLLQRTDERDMFWTSVPTQDLRTRLELPKVLSDELDRLYKDKDMPELDEFDGRAIHHLLTRLVPAPAADIDFEDKTVKFSGKKKDFPVFTRDMEIVPFHREGARDEEYYVYCSSASGKYNFVIHHKAKPATFLRHDDVRIYAYENDIKLTSHLANKYEVAISDAQKRAMIHALKNDETTHLIKQEENEVKYLRKDEVGLLLNELTTQYEYVVYRKKSSGFLKVKIAHPQHSDIEVRGLRPDPTITVKSAEHVRLSHQELGARVVANDNVVMPVTEQALETITYLLKKPGEYFLYKMKENPAPTKAGALFPNTWVAVRKDNGKIAHLPYDQLTRVKADRYVDIDREKLVRRGFKFNSAPHIDDMDAVVYCTLEAHPRVGNYFLYKSQTADRRDQKMACVLLPGKKGSYKVVHLEVKDLYSTLIKHDLLTTARNRKIRDTIRLIRARGNGRKAASQPSYIAQVNREKPNYYIQNSYIAGEQFDWVPPVDDNGTTSSDGEG